MLARSPILKQIQKFLPKLSKNQHNINVLKIIKSLKILKKIDFCSSQSMKHPSNSTQVRLYALRICPSQQYAGRRTALRFRPPTLLQDGGGRLFSYPSSPPPQTLVFRYKPVKLVLNLIANNTKYKVS